jgi:hypothetical protein
VVTVEIEPPTSPPDEPTSLNQNAAPSLCREPTRGEGDLALLVALASGDHIRNLQPGPAESGIDDNVVWARAGMPCAKEVVGIPQSERGVPRSHQRLRGRRVGGTAVKSAATSAVLLAGSTRAVPGQHESNATSEGAGDASLPKRVMSQRSVVPPRQSRLAVHRLGKLINFFGELGHGGGQLLCA